MPRQEEPTIKMAHKLRSPELDKQPWVIRHRLSWGSKPPIVEMILGAENYITKYEKKFGRKVADDSVLGGPLLDILFSIRRLLDGDLDGLDGGTLDSILSDILEYGGFSPLSKLTSMGPEEPDAPLSAT